MKYDLNEIKSKLYCGILSDVLDGMGYRNQALGGGIQGLTDDTVIFGPAFTSIGTQVYSMPENPLIAQTRVVDQLGEGEIYVLVTRGEYNCAVFGELFATAVRQRGGAGVLLDAYARDVRELKQMDFPLFYRGRNPRTSKGRCEINECQIPVVMDGVTIHPGDYIFGDIDGVVVIPRDIAYDVLLRAEEIVANEKKIFSWVENGESIDQITKKGGYF